MHFRYLITSIIALLLIGQFSCSNKSSRSRKPVAQIKIEPSQNKIVAGNDINITVSIKLKDGEIKQSELFLDGKKICESEKEEFNYTLSEYEQLGHHTLKVISVKKDGIKGQNYNGFEIISNIIPEEYTYQVLRYFPHNETFFTEGLEFHNGYLYESTGNNGQSGIYKTILQTGKVIQLTELDEKYFGEGITIFNNRIFQLTYKAQKGFVYELETMALIDSFTINSEQGWGMTHDNQYLLMSDGSNRITYLNPITCEPVKNIQVYDNKGPINYLNEIEYFEGCIYANIWTTNVIVKIDAKTGKVLSRINMEGLLSILDSSSKQVDALNGIAINPETKRMYVTGKLYPKIFEIDLIKKE